MLTHFGILVSMSRPLVPICGCDAAGCISGPLEGSLQLVTCPDCLVAVDKAVELDLLVWRTFGRGRFVVQVISIPHDLRGLFERVVDVEREHRLPGVGPYPLNRVVKTRTLRDPIGVLVDEGPEFIDVDLG